MTCGVVKQASLRTKVHYCHNHIQSCMHASTHPSIHDTHSNPKICASQHILSPSKRTLSVHLIMALSVAKSLHIWQLSMLPYPGVSYTKYAAVLSIVDPP